MKTFCYETKGVCSTKITFNLMDGKLYNLQFNGGCMGNLRAISKLVEGREAKQYIERYSYPCKENETIVWYDYVAFFIPTIDTFLFKFPL